MEIKEFVNIIKEAKKTFKESDEYCKDLKVKVDKKRICYILSKRETCSHCGHTRNYFLTVEFNEKQNQLSLFEEGNREGFSYLQCKTSDNMIFDTAKEHDIKKLNQNYRFIGKAIDLRTDEEIWYWTNCKSHLDKLKNGHYEKLWKLKFKKEIIP